MQSAVSALYGKANLVRGCCLTAAATLLSRNFQLGWQLLRWGIGATRYPDKMLKANIANAVFSAQAAARIFRYGQKWETYVYRCLYQSTMEWTIYRYPPPPPPLSGGDENVQRMGFAIAQPSGLLKSRHDGCRACHSSVHHYRCAHAQWFHWCCGVTSADMRTRSFSAFHRIDLQVQRLASLPVVFLSPGRMTTLHSRAG